MVKPGKMVAQNPAKGYFAYNLSKRISILLKYILKGDVHAIKT